MDTTIAKIITLLLSVVGRVTAIRSYVIPLSLNPFIQSPIRLSGFVKTMYNAHVNFYSKVTLTDVSDDTEKDLKDLVEKKLSVVFLTTHSSYVAKTLTLSDLKFSGPSKWSYNISIDDMIMVSNGSITEFNQDMELYKFQEMAMKVLENRYSFSMSKIQNELGYTMMEFLGADEKQWIDIVGIITQSVIDNQCEKLKITSCYLAKLINKTLDEIKAFTLNEVDKHLYNTTMLMNKLPAFQNTTLEDFYEKFDLSPAKLANMIGVNISVIQSSGLKDQIQLFTASILEKFRLSVTAISTKYKKSMKEFLVPCQNEWDSFEIIVLREAFEQEARNMSITNKTLSSLIQIPYDTLTNFSFESMQKFLATVVKPVKEAKKKIEEKSLFALTSIQDSQIPKITESNAVAVIQAITNFTKSQLSTLYHWTHADYQFSEMFSTADLIECCSSKVYNYSLLTLAKINIGKVLEGSSCKTFNALRAIWDRATVKDIETNFTTQDNLPSNTSIVSTLHSLTNASSEFIFRVLNIESDVQELCSNVSLRHISTVTTHSISYLKHMSFQDIINLVVKLKQNGSLYHTQEMTNATNSVSSIHPNASASMTDLQMISSTSSGTGVNRVTTSSVKINSTNTKLDNSSERSFNSKMGILLLMLIPVIYQ